MAVRVFSYHSISCVCSRCLNEDKVLGEWFKTPWEMVVNAPVKIGTKSVRK